MHVLLNILICLLMYIAESPCIVLSVVVAYFSASNKKIYGVLGAFSASAFLVTLLFLL